MKTTTPRCEPVDERASAWAVRRAGGFTPAAQAEFEEWLAENPLHYSAFVEADLGLTLNGAAGNVGDRDAARNELPAPEPAFVDRRWRRGLVLSAAIATIAAMALLALRPDETADPKAALPPGTIVARPLFQHLPDGSIVQLNASSDIAVEFSSSIRRVRLVRGEAYFTVAKDRGRPFDVVTGRVSVRAVGTQFDVRIAPGAVDVLTTEGRVLVTDALPAAAQREAIVEAGQRTTVDLRTNTSTTLAVTTVSPAAMQGALAWRDLRFELANATLEQAVAWFNERSVVQFAIGDPELRHRRLSGILWANQPDQFAELVASSLDVKAVPALIGRIVFQRR